ncbi:hypothetical protein GCM10027300_31760 [Modestobacter lapidis]
MCPFTVTRTAGFLPAPSEVTTSAGTAMPVAVFPPSSTVVENLMAAEDGSSERRGAATGAPGQPPTCWAGAACLVAGIVRTSRRFANSNMPSSESSRP